MTTFSDEDCETLIELIRKHPPLYDARLDSYRDENLKDNIWMSIAEIINKTDSECRKKWKLIRDSYNRYKRKQKNSTGSAAPAKNSKWQFHERLRFLENTPSERQSSCSVEQEQQSFTCLEQEDTNSSSEVGHEDTPPAIADASVHDTPSRELLEPAKRSISLSKSPEKPTSKNKKRKRQQEDEFIKYLKERHEKRNSKLESLKSQESVDDISTFTKHIEIMLRNMSARSRAMAKTELFRIISKYEIEDIDGQSERPYESSFNNNSYSPTSAASLEHQTQSELIDLSSRQLPNISREPFQSIFNDEFDQNNFHDLTKLP